MGSQASLGHQVEEGLKVSEVRMAYQEIKETLVLLGRLVIKVPLARLDLLDLLALPVLLDHVDCVDHLEILVRQEIQAFKVLRAQQV